MSKVSVFLFTALVLLSCKQGKWVNMPDVTTERRKTFSDVEIIDSIPLDWKGVSDSLIFPGIPFVNRWPAQYECFDGHFVIFVDSLSNSVAELTLLSLSDWDKIMSANGDKPDDASDIAIRYDEFGLTGWMIPSETLARKMKEGLNVDDMNVELATMYGDEIHVTDGSSNARYLCEEAEKTFSFAENTKITNAGAKTKYRLRLVHAIRIARI
ncbi:MAG: hypothetical protein MJZ93_06865 [Paludibacteraceae bacterium]|nr:hypothetical protein [Paludibacteraceae bacterium]